MKRNLKTLICWLLMVPFCPKGYSLQSPPITVTLDQYRDWCISNAVMLHASQTGELIQFGVRAAKPAEPDKDWNLAVVLYQGTNLAAAIKCESFMVIPAELTPAESLALSPPLRNKTVQHFSFTVSADLAAHSQIILSQEYRPIRFFALGSCPVYILQTKDLRTWSTHGLEGH